jgi:dienelactone hydrolase
MGAFPRPRAHRATTVLLACVTVLAALTACGTAEPSPPAAEPSLPEQAPDPGERCGFPDPVQKVVLTTEDGVKLAAANIGTGAHGVVLLPQRGADMCGWSTAASRMVQAGQHVLAIDLRCTGYSDCDNSSDDQTDGTHDFAADAAAAIAALKRAGATKVVVMGASLGAATAVVAGGRFADQVSGVVGLSVFSTGFNASGNASTDISTPLKAGPRITAPTLLVVANGDGSCISAGTAQELIDAGTAKEKSKVVVRDGSTHGWDLMRIEEVETEVLAFLKANS